MFNYFCLTQLFIFSQQVSNACICSLEDAPRVCFVTKSITIVSSLNLPNILLPLPSNKKDLDTLIASVEAEIKDVLEGLLGPGYTAVKITIKSIGGQSVHRRFVRNILRGRQLQANFKVVYEADVEYSCQPSKCNFYENTVTKTVLSTSSSSTKSSTVSYVPSFI